MAGGEVAESPAVYSEASTPSSATNRITGGDDVGGQSTHATVTTDTAATIHGILRRHAVTARSGVEAIVFGICGAGFKTASSTAIRTSPASRTRLRGSFIKQ